MKLNHFLTAAALLAFIGCSQMETEITIETPDDLGANGISATIDSELQTKTSLNSALKVVWSNGDKIKIFGDEKPSGAVYSTANEGTVTGVFMPEKEDETVDGGKRYSIYPASAVATDLSGKRIGIDLGSVSNQSYIAELGESANISKLPMFASSTGREFSFNNLFGGVVLQLNEYQDIDIMVTSVEVSTNDSEQIAGIAYVDVESGKLLLQKGELKNSIKMTAGGIHIKSAGNLEQASGMVVFLPAGTYSKGLNFKITDSEGRIFTKNASKEIVVTPGVVNKLEPLKLTLYYGAENCYLTSAAETIEIDITPYYTFSDKFTHDGNIVKDGQGKVCGVPVSASILWQTAALSNAGSDIIAADPTISGTKLSVTTTGAKGNAVVAVKDAGSNILWSYHIWVSEVNDLVASESITVMDRHLGATDITPDNKDAFGLYYQWGRKDPFDRKLDNPKTQSKKVGNLEAYSSECSPNVTWTRKTEENGTIGYTIAHPQEFIYTMGGATTVNWHNTQISNLWGNNADGNLKTVYDPCPAGYKVAEMSLFELIIANNVKDGTHCAANNGYLMKLSGDVTTYFPLTGALGAVNTGAKPQEVRVGTLQLVDFRGYVWSNASQGNGAGQGLYFNNASINPLNNKYGHELGHAVRCVKY